MGNEIATFLTIVTAMAALGAIADRVIRSETDAMRKLHNSSSLSFIEYLQAVDTGLTTRLGSRFFSTSYITKAFFISFLVFILVFLLKSKFDFDLLHIFMKNKLSMPSSFLLLVIVNFICIYLTIIQTHVFISLAARAKQSFYSGVAIVSDIFIAAHLFSFVAAITAFFALLLFSQVSLKNDFNQYDDPQVIYKVDKNITSSNTEYFYKITGRTNFNKVDNENPSFFQLNYVTEADFPYFSEFFTDKDKLIPEFRYFDNSGKEISRQYIEQKADLRFTAVANIKYRSINYSSERLSSSYSKIDELKDHILMSVLEQPKATLSYYLLGLKSNYSNLYLDKLCVSDKEIFIFSRSLSVSKAQEECNKLSSNNNFIIKDANGISFHTDFALYYWDNSIMFNFPLNTVFSSTIFISIYFYLSIFTFYIYKIFSYMLQNYTRANKTFQKAPYTLSGIVVGCIVGMTAFI